MIRTDLISFSGKSAKKALKTKSCLSKASLILFSFWGALTALKNSYSLDFFEFLLYTK